MIIDNLFIFNVEVLGEQQYCYAISSFYDTEDQINYFTVYESHEEVGKAYHYRKLMCEEIELEPTYENMKGVVRIVAIKAFCIEEVYGGQSNSTHKARTWKRMMARLYKQADSVTFIEPQAINPDTAPDELGF